MRMRPRAAGPWLQTLAALAALAGSACTNMLPGPLPPAPSAPRITGWLHTEGTRILDEDGDELRILSVNVQGMGKGDGSPRVQTSEDKGWSVPTPDTYANIAAWGFNAVRLPIAWANLEPEPPVRNPDGTLSHEYNEIYLSALDGIVRAFGDHGLAVILSMSQRKWSPAFEIEGAGGEPSVGSGMPSWLYPQSVYKQIYQAKHDFFADENDSWAGFADAWKLVAGRYSDDPTVVAVDVINEPYYGTRWLPTPEDLHLDAFYEHVGGAIRSVNPRVLLVFEDSQYKGDGLFGMSGPPPFDNIVYSFHLYTQNWDPQGVERLGAFWERARKWQVPLWIGEFNRFGQGEEGTAQPPSDWTEQLSAMLSHCEEEGISWSYWAYRGRDALGTGRDDVANPELLELLQEGF
ncbi:hypothetical protein BH20ACT24_BH20ACT24_15110 [soil metagenome]